MDAISTALIARALDGLTMRLGATANNIANANTPGYRAIRVRFEDRLRDAASGGPAAIALAAARSELDPLAAPIRLDLEVATASETAMRYGALLDMLGRQMGIARAAIGGGQ